MEWWCECPAPAIRSIRVANHLDRYDKLLAVALAADRRLQKLLAGQRKVILAIDGGLPLAALGRALQRGRPASYHSDQVGQYAASDYVERRSGRQQAWLRPTSRRRTGYAERLVRTIQEGV